MAKFVKQYHRDINQEGKNLKESKEWWFNWQKR